MISEKGKANLKQPTFPALQDQNTANLDFPIIPAGDDSSFSLKVAIDSLASDFSFIKILLDNIPNPIFITHFDSSIKFVNPALEKLTGYSRSELIGTRLPYPWWPREMIEQYLDATGPGKNMDLNRVERSFVKKNGERFWVDVKIQALKQGETTKYFLATWNDLTERRLAEKKLEEAVEEFKGIFHSVNDMISIQDKDCRLLKVNRAYARMLNKNPEELVGQLCYREMHGGDCPIAACPHQQTLQTGKPATANYYEPKLGLHLEISTSPIFDAKGITMGSVHIARDIGERKAMEARLSRVQEFNAQILSNAPNPVVVISGDESIQYVNPAFEKLTGFGEKEVLGLKPPFPYWPKDRVENRLLFSDQDITVAEMQFVKKSEEDFWVRLTAVRIKEDGAIKYHLVNWADITELKQINLSLIESESKFRVLAEQSPNLIFINKGGRIVYVNQRCVELIGYSREEFYSPNFNFLHIIAPNQRDLISQSYRQHSDGLGVEPFEHQIVTKDGRFIAVIFSSKLVTYDGAPAILGTIVDISERKRAEEELRQREQRYKSLFENMLNGFAYCQMIYEGDQPADFIYLAVNRAFTTQTGLADVIGKKVSEVVPGIRQSNANLIQTYGRVASTGIPEKFEDFIPELEMWFSISVYSPEKGYFVAVFDVITERKVAQEKLQKSEEKYSTIVEKGNDGIVILQDGIIKFANSRVEEITGFSGGEAAGKTFTEFVSPEFKTLVFERHKKRMSAQKVPGKYEISVVTRGGKEIPVEVNANQIDFEGKPADIVVLRDITERKEAEAKIKQAQEILQKSYENVRSALESSIAVAAKMVEMKDPYTAGHQQKVAQLSVAIAREMQLPPDQIAYLDLAAKVHDIGKIHVPAEILSKTGKLTELEYQMMMTHARGGYDVLNGVDFPWPLAQIILQHHERLDGSGYPNGLKGDKILLEARIIAVADTVEAMSGHRPYRPSLGMKEALMEIEEHKGEAYDARVVEVCVDLIEKKGFRFED